MSKNISHLIPDRIKLVIGGSGTETTHYLAAFDFFPSDK